VFKNVSAKYKKLKNKNTTKTNYFDTKNQSKEEIESSALSYWKEWDVQRKKTLK